jgi:hypothetical protein
MDPKEALATARAIAMQCKLGNLSYQKGKELAQPYFDIVNEKAKEIAQKYGKKPTLISWKGFTR